MANFIGREFGQAQVTILLGDGTGNFTAAATGPEETGGTPISIAVGDFNEASREIDRLKSRPRQARAELARERRGVSDDLTRRGEVAAVRPDEVEGFGSTARWSGGPA